MSGNRAEPAGSHAVALHLAGPATGGLGAWLRSGDHLVGGLRAAVGPFPALLTEVNGPSHRLEQARVGLPPGPAAAEAVAVRLRRAGVELGSAAGALSVRSRRGLLRFCRHRGHHAVQVVRADPSLLPELQVGSWFTAGWRSRLVRRAALAFRPAVRLLPHRLAADVAFWAGVRRAATRSEWRWLTASYVVLCYHRLSGDGLPGQERWDVAPSALRRQLRVLRLLGWRPLAPGDMTAFHRDQTGTPPRRRYVITADDGFVDAVVELTRHAGLSPQVFPVTGAVGTRADWFDDVGLADWAGIRAFQEAGGIVGSHARRHVRLDSLDEPAIAEQISGSLADLATAVNVPIPLLAYPHGGYDVRVRAAAVRAGYSLAYTTQQGRNGAGTDAWCLRRVEPKIWDTTLSFCWKVVTGESPFPRWERRLERRWRRRH